MEHPHSPNIMDSDTTLRKQSIIVGITPTTVLKEYYKCNRTKHDTKNYPALPIVV